MTTQDNQANQETGEIGVQPLVTSRPMDMTYDSVVRHHKAVDWLMANDPVFRVIMSQANLSPFNAFSVIDQFGGTILAKVAEVAGRMEVTQQEREEGYPLPKDEAERERRMRVKLSAQSSS